MYLPNRGGFPRSVVIVAAISLPAAGVAVPSAGVAAPAAGVAVRAAAPRPGGAIHTGRDGVSALGSWRVASHPSYGAAIRALGTPDKVTRSGSSTCTDTWGALGLQVLFTTFGGGSGCRATLAQTGTISGGAGRARWRTTRGLRVGDTLGRLERLYPGAIKERGARAIVYNLHAPIGEGARLDIVAAQIKGKRVSAFKLWFGGAGD